MAHAKMLIAEKSISIIFEINGILLGFIGEHKRQPRSFFLLNIHKQEQTPSFYFLVSVLFNVKLYLYADVNHSSWRSSFAVGLSLGSSFMILSMNALSSFEISRSVIRPKGFIFSCGTRCMMWVRIANVSSSAISLYDNGNGPKN